MDGTKTCTKCGSEKHLEAFKKSKRSKDGRFPRCKTCENEDQRTRDARDKVQRPEVFAARLKRQSEMSALWVQNHREAKKIATQRYYANKRKNDLALILLWRCKHRAKKIGVDFDLERSDLPIPEVCPVLGVPLFRGSPGKNGPLPNSPSVDRVNPTLGYVKGNVRVISNRANTLKCDASVEELELVLTDLKKRLP